MDAELAGTPHRLWEVGVSAIPEGLRGAAAADVAAREALLAAVVEEVADSGYERAAVDAICRRAGVSVETFEALFPSKLGLFVAAGRDFVDELLGHVRGALRGVEEWETGVRAGLGAFLTYLAAHPQAARAFFVEGLAAGREALAVRDIALHTFSSFLDTQQLAVRDGGGPTPLASEATVGGIYGIVARRVRDGQTGSLPELLSALAYFLLAPVVGCPRARLELVGVAP